MPSTRAPSSMRAFTLRALHDGAAARAGALVQAREEAVEHRRELLLDVGEREELLVQALTAALAVPLEPIELARTAGPLDHEPDGVSGPLRRVRHFGRNEEHLTLADRHIDRAAVLHGLEHHVALELVEELLPGVDVVVLAGIRAADHHDDEVAVAEDALVAHRRPQLRAVGLDPLLEIERLQGFHVPSVPFPLWYAQPGWSEEGAMRSGSGARGAAGGAAARVVAGAGVLSAGGGRPPAGRPWPSMHWPWHPPPPPPAPPVHELDISAGAGAGASVGSGGSGAASAYPQYWNRNTLVVDLAAASGSGSITLKPAARSAWPVRLALPGTPRPGGLLSRGAGQPLGIPLTPAARH